MSFFKKLFSSGTKDSGNKDKKTGAITKKGFNPEHKQIVELYTQKNPTPFTSKEIVESIAEELGKKPGGVRTMLSQAGVYVKQENISWKNNKKLALEKGSDLAYDYSKLSETLQKDRDIAEVVMKEEPSFFENLSQEIQYDRDFVLKMTAILKEDEIEFMFTEDVVKFFKNDREFFLRAWNSLNPKTRSLENLVGHVISENDYPDLLGDRQFMLEVVKENHMNYIHVSPALRADAELLDIVGADDFIDYCNTVSPRLREEKYSDPEDDEDNEHEVIEIP